ncbi:hypothetical protein WKW79_25980 [Variovorax robiniae]|uniref:Uncharacterized protein n=1 Tax=Variovorax robiniae TaxID=1836199 RepID=A0ABU8XDX4_9BURK
MRIHFGLGLLVCLTTACGSALADELKLPVDSDDKGTVYVSPNVTSTEDSVNTKGATVGVERPDGSKTFGGMDTSGPKPSYSAGAETGGKTSFSVEAHSDGKNNTGAKAGVKIKY